MAMSPSAAAKSRSLSAALGGRGRSPASPLSPGPAVASDPMAGVDPIAKRPRALDPAPTAVTAAMDFPGVVSGLCEVHGLVVRDEAYAAHVADCVDANAVILGEIIARMSAVEAKVEEQGSEAQQLKDYVELKDNQLRTELGNMTQSLVDHNAGLLTKIAEEAGKVAAKLTALEDYVTRVQLAASSAPPTAGAEHPALAALDGIRASIVALETESSASFQKVEGISAGLGNTAQKVLVVGGELEAMKVNLGQLAAAFQAQPIPQAASSFAGGRGVDPMQAQSPWDRTGDGGGAARVEISTPPLQHHPHERGPGRWQLYNEKYVLSGKGNYDGRKPQIWLLTLRNYLAGRNEELDTVLDWVEQQIEEIPSYLSKVSGLPAINCAGFPDLSRQLWAFLGPLVAGEVLHGVCLCQR